MSDDGAQPGHGESSAARGRGWRLLALGIGVGGLVLLGGLGGLGYGLSGLGDAASSAGRSLESVVRSPGRGGPPHLESGPRHTPISSVIFYGGYFCAKGAYGVRVRLVWALPELDILKQGSSSVVGPYGSKAQARGAC